MKHYGIQMPIKKIKKEDIIEEARTWLGTPYRHQGRVKGVGCDCGGIVIGVAKELGIEIKDYEGYGKMPHGGTMKKLLDSQFQSVPIEEVQIGDILLMKIVRDPQHLALVTDYGMLHCYTQLGRGKQKKATNAGRVVEHRLDEFWKKRILKIYRFPGVK